MTMAPLRDQVRIALIMWAGAAIALLGLLIGFILGRLL